MTDADFIDDMRARINPAYADQRGTESWERKRALTILDRLIDEIAMLRTGDTCAHQCEGTAHRIEARRLATQDDRRLMAVPSELIAAFVQGAQWWENTKTGATMWQSDQDKAETEATTRLLSGKLRQATPFVHRKTGNRYLSFGTAIDCTNGRDGTPVILYSRAEIFGAYVRERGEFYEKFREEK